MSNQDSRSGRITRWANQTNRFPNDHQTNENTVTTHSTPPPSYNEVTNGPNIPEHHHQRQCNTNKVQPVEDLEFPFTLGGRSEPPPSYESISTVSQ